MPEARAAAEARRRLLELRLRQQRDAQRGGDLVAHPGVDAAPASFAQEALCFLDQLHGSGAAYNVAHALRLGGRLDTARLGASLRSLVGRHDSLRSVFVAGPDGLRQRVRPPPDAAELLAMVDGAADAAALQAAAAEPFDLGRGPLLRARLWRLAGDRHLLLLVAHHIAFDGGSWPLLADELGRLYAAGGDPSVLPPLPLRHGDYAAWQRGPAASEAFGAALQRQARRLAGLEALDLPTDRPRPGRVDVRGGVVRFGLSAALSAALEALARSRQVTLFTLLLAAWQVLLMRSARQHDIAVGVAVAGRPRPELQPLIGHFVNTLVMRSDLSGAPSFEALLQRVQAAALEAYADQDLPFDRLVAELAPQRDANRNPLFQVAFGLDGGEDVLPVLEGLSVERVPVHTGSVKFDLALAMRRHGGGLDGALEYSAALFDHDTARRWARRLEVLLAAIAADPRQPITRLPLLDAAERDRLRAWSAGAPPEAPQALHRLFESQARREPAAPAVIDGPLRLSYGQLEARANRLAQRLRALGAGPEGVVGLCVRRSAATLVGMLGILKSGAAFVPIDPQDRSARRAFVLQDCGAAWIVTDDSTRESLAGAGPQRLCLDADADAIAACAADDPGLPTRPEQLAYVIYTSGSTGRPKGVELTHGGIAQFVAWLAATLKVGRDDRFLHKSAIGFDASLIELFTPLAAGAAVVMAPPQAEVDAALLSRTLDAERISVLFMVPSALQAWLADAALQPPAGLRYLMCGGEALGRTLAAEAQRRLPGVTLGNFYGPTETSVAATWHEPGALSPGPGSVPIGRPVGGSCCRVLDEDLQTLPIGAVGELCIGGAGLARGYRGRPALTAERFVDDPEQPGGRLYRSGDLVRYRADGALEYLGRADRQLKLRGFRIEPGEIEAALDALPGLRERVVLLREDPPASPQLVAYVVGEGLEPAAVRDRLRAVLPEHLLPSAVVVLPTLPRLASGKADLQALPAPQRAAADASPPRSPIEEAVAESWCEVLGLDRLGIHDDFFASGGDSLAATRVVTRARAAFQVAVELRSLFEWPTVAGFAAELARRVAAARATDEPVVPPLQPVARGGPLPVSFSQRRMWLLQQLEPEGAAYNVALQLRLRGALDRGALGGALDAVTRRHEAFRTTLTLVDDEPEARLGPWQPLAATEVDLRPLAAAAREPALRRVLSERAAIPFDLGRWPLHRVLLVRLADDEHVLMLVMHHVIADGWSYGIVLREVAAAYDALRGGRVPDALPPAIEFADYAAWQRRAFDHDALQSQWHYWRDRLAGLQPLALPVDHAGGGPRSSRGARAELPLPAATIAAFKAFSERHGVTPFMTLLAAFQLLLARCCGQDDIAVGTPIANRQRVEAEPLVGSLVNTLVMRTDLSGDPRFDELLVRVRATALGAYAHQDLPFDRLAERLRPLPGAHRLAELQVLFNVHNTPWAPLGFDGLEATLSTVDPGATQFDLALHVDTAMRRSVILSYSTDLFEPATAERLLAGYLALLGQVLDDPARPIGSYRLGSAADRALLHSWNAAAAEPLPPLGVAALVAAGAARQPQAAALWLPDGSVLTHAGLQQRVDSLAGRLRRRGLGRGQRVGLCLQRGAAMLVAQLAILKSGAAYVPLDPAYPSERLRWMARDAGIDLLLAQASTAGLLAWPDAATLRIDDLADEARAEAPLEADASRDAGPEDPAYVIYTSGSTGDPKGVVVPHRAVVNLLRSLAREPGLDPSDRLLAVTTLSFDISVLELLLPLSVGASLAIADRSQAGDGEALRELLESSGCTAMQATPSGWRLLIEAGWRATGRFKALVGGEALPPDLASQLLERCGEVWNLYGPTETTVWSTCWKLDASRRSISIGRPIANTQVHVLDAAQRPCPIGVAGELWIGGAGLALGYHDRPALTAERFVLDPAGDGAGRLYRTGDRGRWCHDGRLEHQGRLDHQVKLRGHRIELGEIEHRLAAHPDVAQALALVREDVPGDARLVAYVVARGAAPTPAALNDWLRVRLPDHMLPQHCVVLDALPLLPNGKLDRRRLPPPAAAAGAQAGRHVAPATPDEQAMAALWQELLGGGPVGVTDGFFDIGGHSLLAMRLMTRIEKRFGRRLPLSALVQARTVREMVAMLRAPDDADSIVLLRGGDGRQPFFILHDGDGETLLYRNLAQRLRPGRAVYGLQPRAGAGQAMLHTRIPEMAAWHVQTIRQRQPQGPYLLGGFCAGAVIAFEVACQLQRAGQSVALLALIDGADVEAALKPGLQQRERLARLAAGLRDGRQLPWTRRTAAQAGLIARKLVGFSGHQLKLLADRLRTRQQVRRLRLELQSAGGEGRLAPGRAPPLSVRQLYVHARRDYRPEGRYAGDVVLCRAMAGNGSAADRPCVEFYADPLFGWSQRVDGRVHAYDLPGGHSSMLQEPHAAALAERLQDCIDQALGTRRG